MYSSSATEENFVPLPVEIYRVVARRYMTLACSQGYVASTFWFLFITESVERSFVTWIKKMLQKSLNVTQLEEIKIC